MMAVITSPQNAKVRQARALRRRKQRARQSLFIIEGIRHVGEALAAGIAMEYVLYANDLLAGDYAQQLLHDLNAAHIPAHELDADIFSSIAEKDNPAGILAVAKTKIAPLNTLTPEIFPWGVALVSPQDPGNLGAILRTIDAVSASGLLLLEDSVDPYHPTAVRASMGALFWHPVVKASFTEFTAWAKEHRYHVYGSSAKGIVDYNALAAFQQPAVLLLGSEREGLSGDQAGVCEQLLRLPMQGHVTSLNLSVAAGVLLYAMQGKLVN